jgi:hypothetical protein
VAILDFSKFVQKLVVWVAMFVKIKIFEFDENPSITFRDMSLDRHIVGQMDGAYFIVPQAL